MCGILRSKFALLILFSFSVLFTFNSCYKKKDTLLRVYVKNVNGQMIEGAHVEIYAEPTDTSNHNAVVVYLDDITNKSGLATFNFNFLYEAGQTGVAILKAKATYYNQTGSNIATIEEEMNNEIFIEIQ